jgi:hypothetical protein
VNPRRTLALVPVVALAGAAAAPAQGATVGLASADPCVRVISNFKTFPVFADGFAPGAFLSFKVDGSSVGSGQTDPAGHFDNAADPFYPPILPNGRDIKTFQLTADDGAGVVAGPVPVTVSNVIVRAPSNARPSKRVRFRVFGFLAGKRVYLHIRRNGKTRGRFSLGTTNAPCGRVTKKMRFMPLRNWSFGTYRYYFSHSKRFSKKNAIYSARVRIYRTFSSTASAHATAAGAWG